MILVSVGAYSGGYTPAAMAVCAAERGSEASTDSVVDSSLAPVQMSAGAHVRDAQVAVDVYPHGQQGAQHGPTGG